MKLTEMLGQYEELLDKKDQLAKDTKDNNAAIDKLKAEIAEMMIDEDIPSHQYAGSTGATDGSTAAGTRNQSCRTLGGDVCKCSQPAAPRRHRKRERRR